MIFETNRMLVRKLTLEDLTGFHEMQSNPNVMKYVDANPKSLAEHQVELETERRAHVSQKFGSSEMVYIV